MSVKYVGADVHGQTTTFVVKGERSETLSISTVRTRRDAIIDFVTGLSGEVHMAMEQGSQARWLYGLLHSRVKELIVCDPRKNKKPGFQGNKSDEKDASELADLLRVGQLTPVFQIGNTHRRLANLVHTRRMVVTDRTRIKNRIKAVFRSRGYQVSSSVAYKWQEGMKIAEQIRESGVTEQLEVLYAQLELLDVLHKEASRNVEVEARRHAAWKLLRTVPGIGSMGAAEILSVVGTPYRFPTKQAFWAYCGLAVVYRTTGDFEIGPDGDLVRKIRSGHTRGLNQNRNPHLKQVFKNASRVSRHRKEVATYFQGLLDKGTKKSVAEVQLARKLATIALTIWKKGETYDKNFLMVNNKA